VRISERYRTSADLPARLPVFPLRGVILLPRSDLPLNIFEPRYLEMFDDMLSGDRLVAMVQPTGGGDDDESPGAREVSLSRVAGVGRLTAFKELEDGRLIVTLTGVSRCVIEAEEKTSKPYRICRVAYGAFPVDLVAGDGQASADRSGLLEALRAFVTARNLEADWSSIEAADTEELVNYLSMISPFGPQEKQALLEAPDLKRRAEILIALARMELAGAGQPAGKVLQ
jgi:Lon protease-like protein